jgi:rhodanese-related sulfurtransferase
LRADLVILAMGVRPETGLAKAAGLDLGERGGIKVDTQMRTSDPLIWAVGDAVEKTDVVTGASMLLPLAGPANRQGRIAADSICGRDASFRGVQGTAVCGIFGLTVAMTGASEKALKREKIADYAAVYLHPAHHVGYYPGAKPMALKLVCSPSDGRVLGAQAVGEEGVERRIDAIAMAIQLKGTVHDLAEAELCYAPQYGGAKDPVNFAGMIAQNARSGDTPLASWSDLGRPGRFLLDVREPAEVAGGSLPGAVNIPLHQLRSRLAELPRDRAITVCCAVGQRGHYATRILRQHGFDAANLSGGWKTYTAMKQAGRA